MQFHNAGVVRHVQLLRPRAHRIAAVEQHQRPQVQPRAACFTFAVRPSALLPQQVGRVCVPFRPGRLHRRHEPPKTSGTSHPDHSICLPAVCCDKYPQFDRGGGALCLQNLGTFGLFSAAVTSYYSCCSDSSCSNVCPRVLPASTSAPSVSTSTPSVSTSPPNVTAPASLFILFILHALFYMA